MKLVRASAAAAAVVVAVVAAVAVPVPVPVQAEDPVTQLGSMKWLAGTWRGPAWGGEFTAYYSTPEGGRILSHSELRKGGKLAFHEFEVFQVKAGAVVLNPYPGGQAAAGFTLASLDAKARRAVFENPKKDFPTRIVYERPADDRLVITLSDPHGKSGEEEVFDLKRVADAGAPKRPARR